MLDFLLEKNVVLDVVNYEISVSVCERLTGYIYLSVNLSAPNVTKFIDCPPFPWIGVPNQRVEKMCMCNI